MTCRSATTPANSFHRPLAGETCIFVFVFVLHGLSTKECLQDLKTIEVDRKGTGNG